MSDRTHYTTKELAKALRPRKPLTTARVLQLADARGVQPIGTGPGPGRSLLWPVEAVELLQPIAKHRRKR